MYQDNIELCCDSMVVSRLSKNDKFRYSQTLVDVLRMSNRRNILPLAASLCSSKSMLKERVMTMIKPHKKSKTALAISLVLALVMVVGGFTTACIPENIQAPKKIKQIRETNKKIVKVEKALSKNDKDTEEELKNETSKFVAPDEWVEELSGNDDIVDMYIDASIDMSNNTPSLIEIKPMEVSQEHIDNFLKAVISETPIYLDIFKNKSDIISEINIINEKLDTIEDSQIKELYDEQLWVRRQVLEDNASDIKIPFNTRLGEVGYVELDKLDEFINSGKSLHDVYSITAQNIGVVDVGKKKPAIVKLDKIKGNVIYNNIAMDSFTINKYMPTQEYLKNKDPERNAEINTIDIAEELGYNLITRTINNINGFDELKKLNTRFWYGCYVNINTEDKIYYLNTSYIHLSNMGYGDSYWYFDISFQDWLKANRDNSVWPMNEAVFIADKNEVKYAEVFAPKSELISLDKKVVLKDLFEIMDIFKDTIMKSDYMATVQSNVNKELYIDGIQLGFKYMYGDQYEGQIIAVPVWNFYGQVADNKDELFVSERGYLDQFTRRICTINAIDGTVISTMK
jgi:hypothetical protein